MAGHYVVVLPQENLRKNLDLLAGFPSRFASRDLGRRLPLRSRRLAPQHVVVLEETDIREGVGRFTLHFQAAGVRIESQVEAPRLGRSSF